jgi:GxxExxY protein
MDSLIEEALTGSIIGAFYEVYNYLGFGFLERHYVRALQRELIARGHRVEREVGVQIFYKGEPLGGHRIDMIVDGKVIIETKSTLELNKIARRQVYNYLRATDLEVGLLLHFGPKPCFYREVHRSSQSKKDVVNPDTPINPEKVMLPDDES